MFLVLGTDELNYDRQTPKGSLIFRERIISSLPTKPHVHKINLFQLTSFGPNEEKIKHLVDDQQVKQVASEVNLNQEGLWTIRSWTKLSNFNFDNRAIYIYVINNYH